MGEVVNLTIEILKNIHEEMRGVREEMRGMREEMRGVRDEVRGLGVRLDRVEAQQAQTNLRLDNLIDLSGRSWRDHERRIRKLEKVVGN